jgi:hypothetical protein
MAIATGTALLLAGMAAAGGSAVSGAKQASAAKKGADAQIDATREGRQIVQDTVAGVNPTITEAAKNTGKGYTAATDQAIAGVDTAVDTAQAGVRGGAVSANEYLRPYIDAGGRGVAGLEGLANGPGFEFDPEEDPGFKFRMEQGLAALERGGAARGLGQSGGLEKARMRYSSGLASQEFQAAFDRFRADRGDRAGMFSTISGMGLSSAGKAGDNLVDAEQYAGNLEVQGAQYTGDARRDSSKFADGLLYDAAVKTGDNSIRASEYGANATMAAGDAKAAGYVGAANGWGAGLAGVTNAGTSLVLGSALRPRAVAPSYMPPTTAYLPGGALAPSKPAGMGW